MTLKFPENKSELTFHSDKPFGKFNGCNHEQVTVHEEERILTCRACGARVEPFDWILTAARKELNIYAKARAMEQRWRDKFEDSETVRKKTCKHTKKMRGQNGNLICMSCNTWFPPEPVHRIK